MEDIYILERSGGRKHKMYVFGIYPMILTMMLSGAMIRFRGDIIIEDYSRPCGKKCVIGIKVVYRYEFSMHVMWTSIKLVGEGGVEIIMHTM